MVLACTAVRKFPWCSLIAPPHPPPRHSFPSVVVRHALLPRLGEGEGQLRCFLVQIMLASASLSRFSTDLEWMKTIGRKSCKWQMNVLVHIYGCKLNLYPFSNASCSPNKICWNRGCLSEDFFWQPYVYFASIWLLPTSCFDCIFNFFFFLDIKLIVVSDL